MDSIISKSNQIDLDLKNLQTRMDTKLTNAQSDEARAKIQRLRDKLRDARKVENSAPSDRKEAEEEYYKYIYGDAYQSQMSMWYYTEANQLRTQLVRQKDGLMAQINQGILYLTSQLTYLQQLERVAGMPSGKKTVEEIKQESTATSIRKAGFFGSSDATVLFWSNIMNCIIFVYGCLLLFVLRNNLTEPRVMITILLTFCSVFALDFTLKMLYLIPSWFIQYIGWGYAPVEFSEWWYLWVPAVLIAIYIIISSIL